MSEHQIQRRLFYDTINGSCVALPNFTPHKWYECDFFRVSKAGYFYEYEIKLSISDFRVDKRKAQYSYKNQSNAVKHLQLAAGDTNGPSRFFYVMPVDLAQKAAPEIPTWAGLMSLDRHLAIVKQAPQLHRKKINSAIIRQAQISGHNRYWDLYLRMGDFQTIERLRSELAA